MITLLVYLYYSHFIDEGTGSTEISTFMYCRAEFRFFCLTINDKIQNWYIGYCFGARKESYFINNV